jgi:hypothetical protein
MSTRRHELLRREGRAIQLKLKIGRPLRRRLRARPRPLSPKVVLEVHIDTDEGNACDLESATPYGTDEVICDLQLQIRKLERIGKWHKKELGLLECKGLARPDGGAATRC